MLVRGMANFLILLFSLASGFSQASPRAYIMGSEFGLKRTEFPIENSYSSVALQDQKSGYLIRTVYSPLGKIEFQEETTAAGRILSRREVRSHSEVQEQFVPEHTRVVYHYDSSDLIRVEQTTWKNGLTLTKSFSIKVKNSLLKCETETPVPRFEQILADIHKISFRPETDLVSVPLGNNIFAENCSEYPNGGLDGLARDLTNALQTGLSCLSQLGTERRMDAARVLAFLDENTAKKAKIRCGHTGDVTGRGSKLENHQFALETIGKNEVAYAYPIDSPDFPALHINLDSKGLKRPQAGPRTLFHEMLHWLGYMHSDGVDVPYLSEICCFASTKSEKDQREPACKILKDNSPLTSEEYQRQFAAIMSANGRPTIAVKSAWQAVSGGVNTAPLFSSIMQIVDSQQAQAKKDNIEYRLVGLQLYSTIVAKAALESLPTELKASARMEFQRKLGSLYSDGPIEKAAFSLGDSLNAILNRDGKSFIEAWSKFVQVRDSACLAMDEGDKKELNGALALGALDLFAVTPSIGSFYDEFKKPCP